MRILLQNPLTKVESHPIIPLTKQGHPEFGSQQLDLVSSLKTK